VHLLLHAHAVWVVLTYSDSIVSTTTRPIAFTERSQITFLPRDATQSAVCHSMSSIITTVVKLRYVSFIIKLLLDWIGLDWIGFGCRLSVWPPVMFRYRDDIGLNTSKIISRPTSSRFMLGPTPKWAIWSNGNTPKIRVEYGWGRLMSTKTCNISETVQDRTNVTTMD